MAMVLTHVRYALATVCFAASIGCLALWWRSMAYYEQIAGPTYLSEITFAFNAFDGGANLFLRSSKSIPPWKRESHALKPGAAARLQEPMEGRNFGARTVGNTLWGFFPLWYPALIFALAGVGVLRFSRQFSIRSALICVSVVALLLGLAVTL